MPHLPLVPGFAAVVLQKDKRRRDVDDGGSHVLPIQPRKSSYLGVGYDLERNGGQVQRVHDEVHQVPPVMDVILEAAVPHLLNLSPDES